MESRMVKFYSKESNMVAIHAIPGHLQPVIPISITILISQA